MTRTRNLLLLIAALLAMLHLSATQAGERLSVAVEAAAYGKQAAWINAATKAAERQVGDTCVFYQVRGAAIALGKSVPTEARVREIANRVEAITAYGDVLARLGMPGKYVGGAMGALLSGKLTPTAEAHAMIVGGVRASRVVIVALSAKPIYRYLSAQRQLDYTPPLVRPQNHVVRVVAVRGGASIEQQMVVIYDTSGPDLVYELPMTVLMEGYNALSARASRGVYVSDQTLAG
ncbi:MAG: hypothetical protein K5880_10460 [Hydrogenophaga sp.]|uniref:hypothetical protein n=1 Tax=Hydrogenophaga sp. TaxID=1904254 RepID=UPI00260A1BFF|nr:hypothetical protein [Hydrogenophaga sp.]MCV0439045.1 hypothetical protein [Hydrogenophaga sp.]